MDTVDTDTVDLNDLYKLFDVDSNSKEASSIKITWKQFIKTQQISRWFLNRSLREKIWDQEEIENMKIVTGAYGQLNPTVPKFLGNHDLLFMAGQVTDTDFIDSRGVQLKYQHMTEWDINDRVSYHLALSGTLFDGTSAYITIKNCPTWFDILIPTNDSNNPEEYATKLELDFNVNVKTLGGPIYVYPYLAYIGTHWSNKPVWVVRVITESLYAMRNAITAAKVRRLETFNDNEKAYSNYYRNIFSMFEINMGEWLILRNVKRIYPADPNKEYNNSLMTFECSLFNIEYSRGQIKNGYQPWPDIAKILRDPSEANKVMNVINIDTSGIDKLNLGYKSLMKDPTLVMTWDIETSNKLNNKVPLWTQDYSSMFMVCYTLHWYHKVNPTLCIGFCTRDVNIDNYNRKHPDLPMLVVICPNELTITAAHRSMIYRFRPAALLGFNDGMYDWPWMYKRVDPPSLLKWYQDMCYGYIGRTSCETNEDVIKKVDKIRPIKVVGQSDKILQYIKTDGYIPIDLMVIMEKRYPKADVGRAKSLNYYIKLEGIDSLKIDLSEDSPNLTIKRKKDGYGELKRIVEEYDSDETTGTVRPENRMDDVLYYCFHDSWLCHKLLHKIDLIPQQRGYCRECKISLDDAIFRADGMKICNLRDWASAQQSTIRNAPVIFTNRQPNKITDKFGGAYVPRPLVGLHIDIPVAGLDFNSLYPMIIVTYNLCPTMIIRVLRPDGHYDFDKTIRLAAEIGFENLNELDFNYRGMNITFWTRRHQNTDKYGNPDGTYDEKRMGVYPWILMRLFAGRLKKKKIKGYLEEMKEDFTSTLQFLKMKVNNVKDTVDTTTKEELVNNQTITESIIAEVVKYYIEKKHDTDQKDINQKDTGSTNKQTNFDWDETWHDNDTIHSYITRKVSAQLRKINSEYKSGKMIPEVFKYAEQFLELAASHKYCKTLETFEAYIEYLEYVYSSVDIEQNTMKILMNTFYGVLGKDVFPIFDLFLAAAVTSMGQENIKYIRKLAINEGCIAMYGDTDSIYISKERSFFQAELDKRDAIENPEREKINELLKYYGSQSRAETDLTYVNSMKLIASARYEYTETVITKTIKEMHRILAIINKKLEIRHGVSFLKVAYEEVICPVYFTGKKRYCGLPHVKAPNLNIRLNELSVKKFKSVVLIKGLDLIKQGHANLTIDVGKKLLSELLDPFSYSNLMRIEPVDIVLNELRRVNEKVNWSDHNLFALSKRYRSDKNNISVVEYVARMTARNDMDVPADGDRFTYVVTKPNTNFNVYGKKVSDRLSSKMEPLEYAIQHKLTIDKAYYMEKQLSNTLKLLILYKFITLEINEIEDDSVWYESLSKKAKSFIISEIGSLLISNDNRFYAPKFFKEINISSDPQTQFVLQTMYNRMSYGRAVVDNITPSELAKLPAVDIIRLISNNYKSRNISWELIQLYYNIPGNDPLDQLRKTSIKLIKDLSTIRLTLEPLLPKICETYEEIVDTVYSEREQSNTNIIFPEYIYSTIGAYVSILNQIVQIKIELVDCTSAINYIQLGLC